MAARTLPYLTMAYLLAALTHGENPAIKVILTDKGLQYVKEKGAEWLLDNMEHATPPDIDGQFSLSILGNVYYSLLGMSVTGVDFPEPSVEFAEDISGFEALISGLSVQVTGTWSTSYGIFVDGGSFSVTVRDMAMVIFVALGMDADGQPSLRYAACRASVGSVSIDLSGGSSWFIGLFLDSYRDTIRNTIEENICPNIRDGLDVLEYKLEALGATFQVNQLLAVEIPLTRSPEVTPSSLSLSLKGQFHSIESPEEPPFEAQPFSLAGEPDHMVSLGLSEYTANSAAYAYYTSGKLHAIITDDMIPPGSPLRLNTNSFGPFVPELPKMYPDMEMTLQVYATEAPEFIFRPGAIEAHLLGAIEAFAITPDGDIIALFQLRVDSSFSGKFRMANGRLTGSVAMDNFTLTLGATSVGNVKTGVLEAVMKLGIKLSGLSALNAKLASGIDLPKMQHAQLTNVVLEVEEGFISVSSDADISLLSD